MDTVGALLSAAARRLAEVTETPRLDAELLLAHALGMSRSKLLTRLSEPIDGSRFEFLLERRLGHEPIAYITGTWEFFSLEFIARAPVLVPRPETEHLVEAALAFLGGRPGACVLDLCTGTGCVAISIAKSLSSPLIDAVDIQPHAVALARENATRHHVDVQVFEGNLFEALPDRSVKYDLIVSNPPYVSNDEYAALSPVILKHEDPVALLAGVDGLDIVRTILLHAPAWLASGGQIALEIGDTQAASVRGFALANGWCEINFLRDLSGHERIFTARR